MADFLYSVKNIYTDQDRQLRVYYEIPANGINSDTGFLLFISGFGGHANSNIYKKMRRTFTETYNLVTIQCDYFGYEFMQNYKRPDIDIDLNYLRTKLSTSELETFLQKPSVETLAAFDARIDLKGNEILDESIGNFADFGPMQAIDNLSAIYAVAEKLGFYDPRKVIAYGHSHGAYLAYMANVYNPTLFSEIIDNSGWLYPQYLHETRNLNYIIGQNVNLRIVFTYMVSNMQVDKGSYFLPALYNNFCNKTRILSFHGLDDELIAFEKKKKFSESIPNHVLVPITESKVDGDVFGSTKHGLNSDYVKLFDLAYKSLGEN
ncbi:DUF2920 family protein [Brevibacillus centrosporus]|uniref:DUF2920 family protein n=1 Tax=Brevibacillus centrosporus TaxID=54910 RepID=UPI002E22306E|nr:DUF2920 family protein [Brevibacillus centrosporus]